MPKQRFFRLPVVSAGAEHLVMGYLMRRNILTYKAPPLNEGYDLICIHPDPRHERKKGERERVRVQVKSRYATNCDRGFPVKEESLDAFDFLIVAFLNIGNFSHGGDGSTGLREPDLYTFPAAFIKKYHKKEGGWQKVRLRPLGKIIDDYKNDLGFELIAKALGVPKPSRILDLASECE